MIWYLHHTFSKVEENQTNKANEETDERFWDAMLNADRKDYERICTEFGVADLNLILKKLEEKKERALNKCKVWNLPDLTADTLSPTKSSVQILTS